MNPRSELLRDAETIVFLCSGNMVRSAFAELYARHVGFPRAVRSGATIYRNDRIYPDAEEALRARGVDPGLIQAFRPTHLDELVPELACENAVFLGMREHHLEALGAWPGLRERGVLLIEAEEIADPVLEGADFGRTFASVARGVDALVRELA